MYLKKLKKLNKLDIINNQICGNRLLDIFRGLKRLTVFKFMKLMNKEDGKRFDENTKMATKVWIRG